jgi:hypothetical protein
VANRIEEVFRSRAECPPIEELVLMLEGGSGPEQKQSCEEHVAHCVHCEAELALFLRFESGQPGREEREPVAAIVARLRKQSPAKPSAWWREVWRPRILMPASAALATLAIVIAINVERSPLLREPSAPAGLDVVRSGRLVVIAPVNDITQTPRELRWQAVRGAARYRVRLLEVDKTELWRATVTDSRAVLPPEIAARVTPLKTLLWDVEGVDEAGRPVASSGIQTFRLLRRNPQ